jgi:hypothetical protein
MERKNFKTRPLQYLPTAIQWRVYEDPAFAAEEARKMSEQYYEFQKLKSGASLQHQNHFDKELQQARKYMMDANSFVVSLRRRGLKLALQDMNIERVIIDEEFPDRRLVVGAQQLGLFPAQRIAEVTGPESKWSTAHSR